MAIKKQTNKRAALERKLRIVRNAYREAFKLEHGYIFCEGCGINEAGDKIDYSHTVGIGKNLALIDHPDNGALMCRTKCHPRVEARDLEGLHNEEKLLVFIQEHDPGSIEKKQLENDISELYEGEVEYIEPEDEPKKTMLNNVYELADLPNHFLRCTWSYPESAEHPHDAICATFEMYFKDGKADEMDGEYKKTVTRTCALAAKVLPDLELQLIHPELIPYSE